MRIRYICHQYWEWLSPGNGWANPENGSQWGGGSCVWVSNPGIESIPGLRDTYIPILIGERVQVRDCENHKRTARSEKEVFRAEAERAAHDGATAVRAGSTCRTSGAGGASDDESLHGGGIQSEHSRELTWLWWGRMGRRVRKMVD